MFKIISILGVSSSLLLSNQGLEVFKAKCQSCHTPFIPIEKLVENFMEEDNKLLNLKAPTLNQISYRLKQQIGNPKGDEDIHRMEVEAFISDYLINPSSNKSLCKEDVLKFFKTMPSMKGKITSDEIEAVSEYIYDYETNLIKEKSISYQSFDSAIDKAKKEDKIIIIKASSKYCHYCKKMDREILIDKDVVDALNKNFISVSIDVSKNDLPLELKTTMTPTFFFIDKNKKLIKEVAGAWGKEDFLLILKEIRELNQKRGKR
jgi:thiol-disulfide isomerase/thioredoxin